MTTSTDANSKGDVADDSASTATGGDNTVTDDSSKKIVDLEKQISNFAAKTRKSDGIIKDLTTKLDAVLSRLSSPDEDDDEDDDAGEDDDGAVADSSDKGKPRGEKGNQNPELRRTLKKLDKTRKEFDSQIRAKDAEIERWKSLYAGQNKTLKIKELLGKHDVLPEYQEDVVRIVGPNIEATLDDDGTIEYAHQDYGSIAKYIEEFLNEKQLYVRNSRKSGTGDGGGADRGQGAGDGPRLPNGFHTWTTSRQREWIDKLTPEQRREHLKRMSKPRG